MPYLLLLSRGEMPQFFKPVLHDVDVCNAVRWTLARFEEEELSAVRVHVVRPGEQLSRRADRECRQHPGRDHHHRHIAPSSLRGGGVFANVEQLAAVTAPERRIAAISRYLIARRALRVGLHVYLETSR